MACWRRAPLMGCGGALWAAIPAAVTAARVRASRPAITACRRRASAVVCVVAGVQEVGFGLAERWVAGGVGGDPGGGAGGGLEEGAGVEVGGVAGVVVPFGGGVVQPGADDPVGVGVGEPGVAQQRPGGQQDLVAEFDGARGEGQQPFGGEGL